MWPMKMVSYVLLNVDGGFCRVHLEGRNAISCEQKEFTGAEIMEDRKVPQMVTAWKRV